MMIFQINTELFIAWMVAIYKGQSWNRDKINKRANISRLTILFAKNERFSDN